MSESRVFHGAIWGVLATVIASSVPITALALGVWPAPEPITAAAFARVLGLQSTGVVASALAVVWQLFYGAMWGAFLGYVSAPVNPEVVARPSTLAQGLGVGILRWLVAMLGPVMWLRWGPFGTLVTPKIAVGTLVADLLFGLSAGFLLARQDAGRVHMPVPRARQRAYARMSERPQHS